MEALVVVAVVVAGEGVAGENGDLDMVAVVVIVVEAGVVVIAVEAGVAVDDIVVAVAAVLVDTVVVSVDCTVQGGSVGVVVDVEYGFDAMFVD